MSPEDRNIGIPEGKRRPFGFLRNLSAALSFALFLGGLPACTDVTIHCPGGHATQENLNEKNQQFNKIAGIISEYDETLNAFPNLYELSKTVMSDCTVWISGEDDDIRKEQQAYLTIAMQSVRFFLSETNEIVNQKEALEGIVKTGNAILDYKTLDLSKNSHPRTQEDGFTEVKDKETEDIPENGEMSSCVKQFEDFMLNNEIFLTTYFPKERSTFLQQYKSTPPISDEAKYAVYKMIMSTLNSYLPKINELNRMGTEIEVIFYNVLGRNLDSTCDIFGRTL